MSDLGFRCSKNFNGMWEFDWASTSAGIDNEAYADVVRWKFHILMVNSAIHESKPKGNKGKRRRF